MARLERWTDAPLTVLGVALVPLILAPMVFDLPRSIDDVLPFINATVWGIFAADLAVKLAIAPHRGRYLRAHWFDAVLVLLPILRPLRIARSLRLVRAAPWGRLIAALFRAIVVGRRLAARRGAAPILLVALIVVIAAGGAITVAERSVPDSSISDLGDGLWWAATTVTTVGYGDTYPTTAWGRGIAVALMICGISLFGIITAALAALFVEQQETEQMLQLRRMEERLERIESELLRRT